MMKVLIADDEPLVQIGMKSMIDWNSLDLEICGTASNGDSAYEAILKYRPEIVITDIKMPCSSGLELAKRCRNELGNLPVFIILTCYEEFSYIKEAMSFHAVDYLVKIDLSSESLISSLQKAKNWVRLFQKDDSSFSCETTSTNNLLMFKERFFIRLLNNLFETREQFLHQSKEFQISINAAGYVAAHIEIQSNALNIMPEKSLQSYQQTLHMFQEIINKYLPCHIVPLDSHYFASIFLIDMLHMSDWMAYILDSLQNTYQMLHNYFNVNFLTSIGRKVTDPLELSVSYYDAKQLTGYLNRDNSILFWEQTDSISSLQNVFNLSLFRNDIVQAFEELNEAALKTILDEIISLLSENMLHYSQALDVASSILHLSINLLSNGPELVSTIFSNEPENYRSLYRLKTTVSIIDWLRQLEYGLCEAFKDDKQCHRHYLVDNCCKYIQEHLRERIVLQNIADTFGVSPNYIGQLFKKYMNIGVTEYITNLKINEAKRLLRDTNLKIYEISDYLGFESAFYFSKVFKKVTKKSPKDYRNI